MQSLNLALFDAIAAGFTPDPSALSLAVFTTAAAPWLAAAAMALAAYRRPTSGPYLLIALAMAVATAMLTKDIAAALDSPRPFMAGLSPSHVAHGARGGLPSTHAAVMFAVAFLLMLRPGLRATGAVVAVLAAATAWSRIYLGIHFPLDIVAGALLGAVVAGAAALGLSTLAGHRGVDAADPPRAMPTATHPLARVLLHCNASRYAILICAAVAFGVGLAMPSASATDLVRDGGALETGTLMLYLVAVVGVLTMRPVSFGRADKAALAVVLLALAAHEADMLDLRTAGATPAAVVPLALAAACVWLALQFGAGWRHVETRPEWRTPAVTVMMFIAVALFATLLDQTPDTLAELGLRSRLPELLWLTMLSLEEMLELLMPVLALLALLQVWLGRPRLRTAAA